MSRRRPRRQVGDGVLAEAGVEDECIRPEPANEGIVAATPDKPVVTVAAEQPVGAGVAADDVGPTAPLVIHNAHPLVIAAVGRPGGAGHEVDIAPAEAGLETGGIPPVPAIQEVVTATPGEPVVTVAAEQPVGAGV